MRCPECKAYLPYDSKLKKCAACGTPITKKPFFEDMLNMTAELAADKNFIFWGISALFFWVIIGAIEFASGGGDLYSYFEGHIIHSLILFLFWGFIVELIAKANAQIRIASKTVILKERIVLRFFRLGTNFSFLIGLALSVVWIGWSKTFANFPALTLITITTICIFWAFEGMYFREKHFEDHRVRNFFLLMGVRHPHPYRVTSAWFLSGTFFALLIYWVLKLFPSIFWGVYNSWLVQSTINFILEFLSYFPAF
jgi:hypothetical protein